MELLKVENLCKTYSSFKLQDVSFSLEEGYIMGFIGRNGAGKTTTIKSMLNIVSAEKGSSKICGYDIQTNEDDVKKSIGFISGTDGFYSTKKETFENTIFDMFGLQMLSLDQYLDEIMIDAEWESFSFSENTEFLRLTPPFSRGYWEKNPNKEMPLGLARYGMPNKIFVFYRYINGIYQQKTIPSWRLSTYFSDDYVRGKSPIIIIGGGLVAKSYLTLGTPWTV